MPDSVSTTLPPPNAEQRRIAIERFDRANQVIATGDYDYAIQLLTTCCKIDPANLQYRQTLRRTQKAKFDNNLRGSRFAMITTAGAKTRLKTAKRNTEYLRVLEYGEEILTANPWDIGTQMDMAEAADSLGLLDLAIFILDQARQKNPKDPTMNRALARLFEKRGNFSHAIKLWNLVKEAVPGDVEAAHKAKDLAASETIQRGKYEETASDGQLPAISTPKPGSNPTVNLGQDRLTRETGPLLVRIENNPTDPHLYSQLALVYKRNSEYDRARSTLQQGLAATGNAFQLMIELMELDLEPLKDDLEEAELRVKNKKAEGSSSNEDDGPSLDELRSIRNKLRREINNREIELFRTKAERFPGELIHHLELGIRLLKADQIEQAIVELQLARKDPKLYWKSALYLGHCFKKRNNWKLAQRNFEEALCQLPENEDDARKDILFQLAVGTAESGDWKKAIDLGNDLANIDFAYRNISQLLDDWQKRLQDE